MEPITSPVIEDYMQGLIPARTAVLEEMEYFAKQNRVPIVGPLVGGVLYQLARLIQARRIFEMGSAIGYSTIWFARAVGSGGKVYFTDGSPANAAKADDYAGRDGVRDRIEILTGNSLDLIDQVDGEFDIIFNDVDKHYYPEVHRKAAGRVRVGGLFVTDNVLWSGRVADPSQTDDDTEGVRSFNKMLFTDDRFHTTIIPLRDGVSIGLRVR